MLKWLTLVLISISIVSATGQTSSSRYQAGVITAVNTHQNAQGESDTDVMRYDVSIKVGNTIYVALYTPPTGRTTVEYSVGLGLLVLVKGDTLTCNKFSQTDNLPILRRETLAAKSNLDLSRIPGEYFNMKQQHLSEVLGLTDDQHTKIQPILEQESGEVSQLVGNPSLSRKEKLNRWGKIVQSSDKKLEPLLSQVQLGKLHELRKEQKPEMKKLIDEGKTSTGQN
jgi:hypothetical protein